MKTREINRCGETGRPGADNDAVIHCWGKRAATLSVPFGAIPSYAAPMDNITLIAALVGCVALFTLFFRWLRPNWTALRTSLVAALIAPGVVIILCAIVYFDASSAPAERCGIDACGMAMMAAIMVSGMAVIAFLLSWPVAFLLLKLLARR